MTSKATSCSITTSAGVGIYPVDGEDAETLMKSADMALYEAKRAGKNAYRISERTIVPHNLGGETLRSLLTSS